MKRKTDLSYLSGYAAYIPVYENGNSVMAVKDDGQTVIFGMGIKTLIKALLKESSIDIKSLRQNFSGFAGKTNLIPIPLKIGRVLIPVKVRKVIAVNDGSYGYIDLFSIEEVSGKEMPVIKLKCGFEISCLETRRTVNNRMKIGEIVMDRFASHMMGQSNLREGIAAVSSEYGSPATKGDITMLAYEIMKLRENFHRASQRGGGNIGQKEEKKE